MGAPKMSNPSIEEVKAVLDNAHSDCEAYDGAERNYQHKQEKLRAIREDVDEMIGDLAKYFRYSMKGVDPVSRQRTMRRYGYTFSQKGMAKVVEEIPMTLEIESKKEKPAQV